MIPKRWILVTVVSVAMAVGAVSVALGTDPQTVGLFVNDEQAYGGYTMFAPNASQNSYLIDENGLLVNSWTSDYTTGVVANLLEDGTLLRTANIRDENPTFAGAGGGGGRVELFDWDSNLLWEFEYSVSADPDPAAAHMLHHDVEMLPNGNILMIAWEYKTAEEAIAAGRDPALIEDGEVWPDTIIEVEPTGASGGNIVWEWHVWDHLIQDFDPTKDNFGVVEDHPELIDINFGGAQADWNHWNAIDYNPDLDQVMISVHRNHELWVVDHSTTTEQAASHSGGDSGKGGDLLYRWGNPQAYGAGDADDQVFFRLHDTQWIVPGLPGEGNILVFNNGNGRLPENYSSVEEIVPPVDEFGNYSLTSGEAYGPEAPTWIYVAPNPTDFYSSFISGAQRLPNGNTLIDAGAQGTFFEVLPDGTIVWKYISPVTANGPLAQGLAIPNRGNIVFRAYRFNADFPGFDGQDLTPGDVIELPKGSVTKTPTLTPTATIEAPTATPTATAVPAPDGDVDGDGFVTSLDALLLLQFDAGFIDELPNSAAADVNLDGMVNSLDAVLILQFDAGLLDELPQPA